MRSGELGWGTRSGKSFLEADILGAVRVMAESLTF